MAITVLTVLIGGLAVLAWVLRSQPVTGAAGLGVVVWAPYIALLSLAAVGWAALRANVFGGVAAAMVAVLGIGTQVAWYHVPDRAGDAGAVAGTATIRVLSANLRNGEADAPVFVRLAESSADVVMVTEVTPEAVQRFSRAGMDRVFPHAHLIAAPQAGGVGIWSRYPLTPLPLPRSDFAKIPAARVALPGVGVAPLVASVHIKSPRAGDQDTVGDWREGLAYVAQQLDRFATIAGAGAVIVGGDFNATPDVRQFRDLLRDGYRDSVHQSGAGFHPTFPSDRWYPPLIVIDHVLTRGASASSVTTVEVVGSDHRGVLATVSIPTDPAPARIPS